MYKRILVPLDGSALAEHSVASAADLAERFSASLLLLFVLDRPEAMDPDAARRMSPSVNRGRANGGVAVLDRPAHRVGEYLKKVAAGISIPNVVKTSVEFGDAAGQILKTSEVEGIDLIAMTTRGRSGVVRGLLGSITDRVIRGSRVPVFVMRPDMAVPFGNQLPPVTDVIVPLDGSERAAVALPHAEMFAKAYRSGIVLVRSVPFITGADPGEPGGSPAAYQAHTLDELLEDARHYVEAIKSGLISKGYTVKTMVARGSPRAHIITLCEERPNSMVAITTRGLSGVTRWVLGSVADGLIRTAPVPTLVIRPDGAA
ncbi:MAG: universal stress protein [Chloroflexi bacterium]|nr:universal stress protein [Chloroflexota bacterium]